MLNLLATCVYPDDLSKKYISNKNFSLNKQFILFILSCKRYYSYANIYVFTNKKKLVNSMLQKYNRSKNIYLLPEENNFDITHCENHSGEHFTYAFSKLDAIHCYEKSKYFNPIQNIILTDLDAILLPKKVCDLKFFFSKDPIAIDYKNELEYGFNLHKVINKINKKTKLQNLENGLKDHWINSGFLILNKNMIKDIKENSKSLVENLRKKRVYAKKMIDHYSDEIVFSSFFKNNNGKGIPNVLDNKIANFYWTTKTKTKTLEYLSFHYYPLHIHLPASKYQNNFYLALKNIMNFPIKFPDKFEVFLTIFLINLYGFYGRRLRPFLSKLFKKIIFLGK